MATLESTVERYRQCIQDLLRQYADYKPSYGDIEVQTVFDTHHDHYQLMLVGWDGKQRIHGCSIHLDLKGEKVWIQANSTELNIAEDLVEQGVAKEDIVIGFQPPYLWPYSGYASA